MVGAPSAPDNRRSAGGEALYAGSVPSVNRLPLLQRPEPGGSSASPGPATSRARRRVALVCAPFPAAELPSLAIGTLPPPLRQHGDHVDLVHLTLDFAPRIGFGPYEE